MPRVKVRFPEHPVPGQAPVVEGPVCPWCYRRAMRQHHVRCPTQNPWPYRRQKQGSMTPRTEAMELCPGCNRPVDPDALDTCICPEGDERLIAQLEAELERVAAQRDFEIERRLEETNRLHTECRRALDALERVWNEPYGGLEDARAVLRAAGRLDG